MQTEIRQEYEDKIFCGESKGGYFYLFTFTILFFVAFKIMVEYLDLDGFKIILIIPALLLGVAFVSLMISSIGIAEPKMPLMGIFVILMLFVVPLYVFTINIYKEGGIDYTRLIDLNVATISIGIIQILARFMSKRTQYGTEILGKLRGFKRFLKTAEKEELENLVEQNPEYFYNILPYTYAFGVSDVWISKFEKIAIQPPDWYVGYTTFNMNEFNYFMNDTMKSVQTVMSSSPSSNSGGSWSDSSSGGGSSGGGSGGGGGGSW